MGYTINPLNKGKMDYFREIQAGQKLYLDRATDTYLIYNPTTNKVELFKGGVKKVAW